MSDQNSGGSPQRAWHFYIDDMIGFAMNVLSYTEGFDQIRFDQSKLNFDATVRNLELIGEAATHIPQHVRDLAPQIQWRLIIATRNRLIHGYLGIDNDTLWSIVRENTPALLTDLQSLKNAAAAVQIVRLQQGTGD
jgi:uncharacterized protein with HEPN domain